MPTAPTTLPPEPGSAAALARPRLSPIVTPLLGEFLLGMSVAWVGLWLASHESDAAGGAFGLGAQVLETLAVVYRVLAIGVGIVVTQWLGAGRPDAAQHTARLSLAAGTWAGTLCAAWLLLGRGLTLDLLNAPAQVVPLAAPLLLWLAPGLFLEAYNLSMASILRAHLRSRQALMVMICIHSTHLLLATLLMRGVGDWEGLGLEGYAVGYAVSRALGLGLHLWLWRRHLGLVPAWRDGWQLQPRELLPVLRIGGLGATQEMAYRLGFMMSLAAAARLGAEALATQAYVLQTLKYVLLTSMAIGWACEIMVGRLVGAGDFDGAHRLVNKGVRNGLLASGLLALAAALAAPVIMQAFTHNASIIAMAGTLLWVSVLLETGRVFNLIVLGALRSAGDAVWPVATSITSQLLVLGLGSLLMGRWFGLVGIWFVYAADEWLRGLLMLRRWQGRAWLAHAQATHARVQGR